MSAYLLSFNSVPPSPPEAESDIVGSSRTYFLRIYPVVVLGSVESRYSLYARILLMGDVLSVLRCLWLLSVVISLLPLYLGKSTISCSFHVLVFYTYLVGAVPV